MAIPKKMRLPARRFHERALHVVSTPFFSLKALGNHAATNRIGMVAGVAVHKSAAKRNFWRRQAGEVLRTLPDHYGDLLLLFFPKVNTLTKKEFKEKLMAAAREIKKRQR